jgi:quercetin dioxygenase-like cupin family protein
MTKILAALCAIGSLAGAAWAADTYQTNVNTIIGRFDKTVIGQPIVVPKNPTVVFSTSTFAPGARTPEHKHPYPHYVCIQSGTLTIVGTEVGKEFSIKAGSCFVEMVDKWHYGINKGAVPAVTLVADQVPTGVEKNNVVKPPK